MIFQQMPFVFESTTESQFNSRLRIDSSNLVALYKRATVGQPIPNRILLYENLYCVSKKTASYFLIRNNAITRINPM